MTPYYSEAGIEIYHGDAREMLPAIGGCLITDPPYGFGHYYHDDERGVAESLYPFVRKAVFGYPETLCRWCRLLGEPDEWITWWPTNKTGGRCGQKLPRTSEAIAIWGELFEKPIRERVGGQRFQTYHEGKYGYEQNKTAYDFDVWRDPAPGMAFNAHQRLHPNEKPESLMLKLVKLCSQAGETILDPYMGSGTTIVAAKQLGRRAIGIEIEERYCEIAANRLRQEVLKFEAVA